MSTQGLCKEKARQVNRITAKSDDRLLTLPTRNHTIRLSPGPRESDAKPSLGQVAKGCGGFPFPLLSLRTTVSPLPVGEKLSVIIILMFDLFLFFFLTCSCTALQCQRHTMNITKDRIRYILKTSCSLKESDTNTIYSMIPFVRNVQNKPVHKDSM